MPIPTAYAPGTDKTATPVKPTTTPFPTAQTQPTAALPADVPITTVEQLYLHSYRPTPDVTGWSLSIEGLVDHPLTLTMDDIHALPPITSMRTLECIGNAVGGGLIGNVTWTGVRLADILAKVSVQSAAAFAHFEASDQYTTSVKLEWLTQPDVMLAYAVNGAPLPPDHGYPLRLLIPGLYGQKQPKWITRINFMDHDVLGYWEGPNYGWSNLAVVKTNSQIVTPYREVAFANPIRVEGSAYAGKRAITRVEVSTTGTAKGAVWIDATLIKPSSKLAWTWWVYDWSPPAPGRYTLAVRATDDTGYTQSLREGGIIAGAFPDGSEITTNPRSRSHNRNIT